MAYRIKKRERVGKAVRRIVREQLRAGVRAARDSGQSQSQEERVHEVRTRLKRSRAALALLRRDAGGKAKRDDRRLRDAGRLLARPRDLAVQAHTFRVLETRLQAELPPRLLARLAAAERQLRRVLEPDEVARDLARVSRTLRRVRRNLGKWEVPRGRRGCRSLATGLAATYRDGRKLFGKARVQPTPKRLHQWRKQVKALSNGLRIVGRAVPELTTTLMPKIDKLAELLGEVHDLDCVKATTELHPRWFGRAGDGEAVMAAVDGRRAALEREALALAESVFAGRPRDVRALVETGWRIWRRAPEPELALLPDILHAHAAG